MFTLSPASVLDRGEWSRPVPTRGWGEAGKDYRGSAM